MRACFLTLEGPEGSGKSTQAKRLASALTERGIDVLCTREPGGTPTGDLIRGVLQHETTGEPICAEAELLLFAASRAQLVSRVIEPALARGAWVICDRFIDSTTAYQGYARGFSVDTVQRINQFATAGRLPDLTLLLDISVADGAVRMQTRSEKSGQGKDRFEREEIPFHERVRQGYLSLAAQEPNRFRVIDAAQGENEVFDLIWAQLSVLLEAQA